MTSDDLTDAEEDAWVAEQRHRVVAYLKREECQHGGVGEWPAFHVPPYFALWAVQSRSQNGTIGWWAVSGDIPTDYMSSNDGYHPRDAMRHFAAVWSEAAICMAQGKNHPEVIFGDGSNNHELALLLASRAKTVKNWADDDDIWDEEE
jgi:hypothetical protein